MQPQKFLQWVVPARYWWGAIRSDRWHRSVHVHSRGKPRQPGNPIPSLRSGWCHQSLGLRR